MRGRSWESCVHVLLSVDGFIARPDGDLSWLRKRLEDAARTGAPAAQDEPVDPMDHLVVGRRTYEAPDFAERALDPAVEVLVLSRSLEVAGGPVRVVRSLQEACGVLDGNGARHVHLAGGQVIRTFLAANLVDEFTLTYAPVLIGAGIRPFGPLPYDIDVRPLGARTFPGGFIRFSYRVLTPTRLGTVDVEPRESTISA